jgi:hypothetical protein
LLDVSAQALSARTERGITVANFVGFVAAAILIAAVVIAYLIVRGSP